MHRFCSASRCKSMDAILLSLQNLLLHYYGFVSKQSRLKCRPQNFMDRCVWLYVGGANNRGTKAIEPPHWDGSIFRLMLFQLSSFLKRPLRFFELWAVLADCLWTAFDFFLKLLDFFVCHETGLQFRFYKNATGRFRTSVGIFSVEFHELPDEFSDFPGRTTIELFTDRHEIISFLSIDSDNQLAVFRLLFFLFFRTDNLEFNPVSAWCAHTLYIHLRKSTNRLTKFCAVP